MSPPIKIIGPPPQQQLNQLGVLPDKRLSLTQYDCKIKDEHVECSPFVREFVRQGMYV